jgi:hypothetical protein
MMALLCCGPRSGIARLRKAPAAPVVAVAHGSSAAAATTRLGVAGTTDAACDERVAVHGTACADAANIGPMAVLHIAVRSDKGGERRPAAAALHGTEAGSDWRFAAAGSDRPGTGLHPGSAGPGLDSAYVCHIHVHASQYCMQYTY